MSIEPEDPDVLSMARLRAGDDLALNEIMDRWQRRLISFLVRVTGNEAAAVDLAEETFVRVYQSRARYRPTGAFSTW
ncbi:MAG TPA: sigma factor, partial [Terrimicrobiaceae bacterium]